MKRETEAEKEAREHYEFGAAWGYYDPLEYHRNPNYDRYYDEYSYGRP